MVWNSEFGLLVTCGHFEGVTFSQLVSELDASRRSAYAASKIVLVVSTSQLCSTPLILTTALHEGTP